MSTVHSASSVSLATQSKKHWKRTPKACDYCRSKKIKCDGQPQCSKCIKHHLICTYNYVPKKRTIRRRGRGRKPKSASANIGMKSSSSIMVDHQPSAAKRTNSSENLDTNNNVNNNNSNSVGGIGHRDMKNLTQTNYRSPSVDLSDGPVPELSIPMSQQSSSMTTESLESRLDRMESMVKLLVNHVVPEQANGNGLYNQLHPVVSDSRLLNVPQQMMPTPSLPILESGGNFPSSVPVMPSWSDSKLTKGSRLHDDPCVKPSDDCERYFGGHTSISFFSSRGLKWMDNQVQNRQITAPLRKFLSTVVKVEHKMLSVWVDPIEKSELAPLPSRKIINKLLREVQGPSILSKLIDLNLVNRLYKTYCDYHEHLTPEPQFTYSELLLMNVALLMSCTLYSDRAGLYNIEDPELTRPIIGNMVVDLLNNALFYYHRVSVVFDGLTGIKGSLLLALYADLISLSQSAYLISSTAIRQAQDMGLHRSATYMDLSPNEKSRRLLVWWSCYAYDRDLCMRCGKPPIISDDDVSAPPIPGFEKYWTFNKESLNNRDIIYTNLSLKLEKLLKEHQIGITAFYLSTQYSFIVSKSYKLLFAANSLLHKSPLQIYRMVQSLLQDLEEWRMSIPRILRPTKGMDPKFTKYIEREKREKTGYSLYCIYIFVSLYFRYYHMRLTLSKAIIKIKFLFSPSAISKQLFDMINKVGQSGVDASLIILNMACKLKSVEFANFCLFYPFGAFIAISAYTLQKPDAENSKRNVKALIACTRHFFSRSTTKPNNSKWWVIDRIIRRLLFIVVRTVCKHNPTLNFDCEDLFDEIIDFMKKNGGIKKAETDRVIPHKHSVNTRSKRSVYNVPVASLISPPALRYPNSRRQSVPSGLTLQKQQQQRQQQQQQQQFPGSSVQQVKEEHPLDPPPPLQAMDGNSLDGFDDRSAQQVLRDLNSSQNPQSFNSLFELFTRNEDSTPSNDSDISNSDTFQADGESLFQNMFNIPDLQLDMDGSTHFTGKPPDLF